MEVGEGNRSQPAGEKESRRRRGREAAARSSGAKKTKKEETKENIPCGGAGYPFIPPAQQLAEKILSVHA